ncbi:ORF6N domain-containing protein [Pedobacter sp. MC2016-15]|uniref:ORF6N domain-containing protein n=1 Tax=Pedobacter sp. MC2016-15 TaxID=2994473 RepID=UPI00224849A8|nr:ORF6N domain-containing protein [Pedobacter sp. MC2016-15]MCX2480774.1 ORF6N domain-containing protein [Pedobacter sp. MC2016-15]
MEQHNNNALIPDELVVNKIFQIRGQKVMLDFDLAIHYEVETRILKQSVRRNILRFPEDFMFQLTKKAWQEVITNCDNLPNGSLRPANPKGFALAFTENTDVIRANGA